MDQLNSPRVTLGDARDKVNEVISAEADGTFGGSSSNFSFGDSASTGLYATGQAVDIDEFVWRGTVFGNTAQVSGAGVINGCRIGPRGMQWVTLEGDLHIAGYNSHHLGASEPYTQKHAANPQRVQIPWNDYSIDYNGGYLNQFNTQMTGKRIASIKGTDYNDAIVSFLTEGGELWMTNGGNHHASANADEAFRKSYRGLWRNGTHVLTYASSCGWQGHYSAYYGYAAIWNGTSEPGEVDMDITTNGYKSSVPGQLAICGDNTYGQCGNGATTSPSNSNTWEFPTLTVPAKSASGPNRGIASAGDMSGLTNQQGNVIMVKHCAGSVYVLCENGTVWGAGANIGGALSPGIGQAGDATYATSYDSTFIDQPLVGAYVKKFLCLYGWVPGTFAAWGKAINVWSTSGLHDHSWGNTYILTDKGNLLACGARTSLGYTMDDGYHDHLNTDTGSYKRNFDIIAGPNKDPSSDSYTADLSLSVKKFWHNSGQYQNFFIEFNDPDQRGSTLYSFGYNGTAQLGHSNSDHPYVGNWQGVPYVVRSPLRGTWKAETFDNPIHGADPNVDYVQSANMAGPDNWVKIKDICQSSGVSYETPVVMLLENGRCFCVGWQGYASNYYRIGMHGQSYFFEGDHDRGSPGLDAVSTYSVPENPHQYWSYKWREINTADWIGKVIQVGAVYYGQSSSFHFLTDSGVTYAVGKDYYLWGIGDDDQNIHYQSAQRTCVVGAT